MVQQLLTGQHLRVGTVGDGEQMGWHFGTPTATVHLHHSVGVDGETFVRIDHHTKQSRVGLDVRGTKSYRKEEEEKNKN